MLIRFRRLTLGDHPWTLLLFAAPTLLSIAIDLVLRGNEFVLWEPHGVGFYVGSLLVSAAFWVLPLLVASRLLLVQGKGHGAARVGLVIVFCLWVFPIGACSYGGQVLYYRVFSAYAGRDTLRLGALLRGSLVAWFLAWGSRAVFIKMLAAGAFVTLVLYRIVRWTALSSTPHRGEANVTTPGPFPLLPVLVFIGSISCLWTDTVDSRYLQAGTPDACFLNGAVHMLRAATTGAGRVRQGVTLRTPAPLEPLVSVRTPRPNVLVILTESVRADVTCSDPPPQCKSPYLDEVASDRIALGKLTSQTPNTFSACMVLWTGLSPNADFADAHTAPTLWEIARAAGYHTAYVTSQNAKYEDLGIFVHQAGIDFLETSTQLGGMEHEQLGAPDERATEHMLRFLRGVPASAGYFALLHLSNTHHPYRSDPSLVPFTPESAEPFPDVLAYKNHYKNSVRLQERLVTSFLREVRALPSWDKTVVIFLSDHGEPFGEHGVVHHNHSVFDEELRVPGWLVAGSLAIGDGEREALRTYRGVRTFTSDVNATVVDLLGVGAIRSTLPLANLVKGRSLLTRHEPAKDPAALLATATGVWEPYDAWFGVMKRESVIVGSANKPWRCFDLVHDPGERAERTGGDCPELVNVAQAAFGPGIGGAGR